MLTISVIIPSYQRKTYLLQVLDCLSKQTYQPDEVFVIDASPPKERLSVQQIQRLPSWLQYIPYEGIGNISKQRNKALMHCLGDIVLFLDDDVEFSSDLIEIYLELFQVSQVDGISGGVLLPNETPSSKPKLNKQGRIFDPGGPNYQAFNGVKETHVICTANFAVKREAVMAVGGFDENIHGVLDDVDLGLRLVQAGYRIIHHNKPQVLHLKVGGSGSRSPDLNLEWQLSNLFYFQFRHFYTNSRRVLLWYTLWQYCRPSRHWLTPKIIKNRYKAITNAYQVSLSRLPQGTGGLHQ
jgi:GT2 family glycosyltransferase